jgi:hypothetical protein
MERIVVFLDPSFGGDPPTKQIVAVCKRQILETPTRRLSSLDLDTKAIIMSGFSSLRTAIPSAEKAEEKLRIGEVPDLFRAF